MAADRIYLHKIILPIFQAMFFQPDRIMPAYMRFVRMIPAGFNMFKTVPRTMKIAPEIQISQRGLTFYRFAARLGPQRLKMGFANQGCVVTVLLKFSPTVGTSSGNFTPIVQQPCHAGYMPVIMVERDGEHTGLLQYARVKLAPSRANWSKCGV